MIPGVYWLSRWCALPALRPIAIIMEQVPQFLNHEVADILSDKLSRLGYELHIAILNAVNYHVPQDRKRAILVGIPQGARYTFPTRTHVWDVTVGDVLNEISPPGSQQTIPHASLRRNPISPG